MLPFSMLLAVLFGVLAIGLGKIPEVAAHAVSKRQFNPVLQKAAGPNGIISLDTARGRADHDRRPNPTGKKVRRSEKLISRALPTPETFPGHSSSDYSEMSTREIVRNAGPAADANGFAPQPPPEENCGTSKSQALFEAAYLANDAANAANGPTPDGARFTNFYKADGDRALVQRWFTRIADFASSTAAGDAGAPVIRCIPPDRLGPEFDNICTGNDSDTDDDDDPYAYVSYDPADNVNSNYNLITFCPLFEDDLTDLRPVIGGYPSVTKATVIIHELTHLPALGLWGLDDLTVKRPPEMFADLPNADAAEGEARTWEWYAWAVGAQAFDTPV